MRLLGYPLRRRRSRGQALVEFALVIPIFLTILVSIGEFMFLSTAYISVDFASHDASEVAAIYGNTAGADCAVLQRIDNDIMAPANPMLIKTVDIYWVNTSSTNASPMAGAENIYTYNGGNNPCTKPDGTTIYVPFPNVPTIEATSGGYPESTRCNVNQAIGCASGHTAIDTIAVKITYQYNWVTPFPQLISGSGTGPLLTVTNMMRLEPVL
jgi:Flp pilus assembly protein TadG